MADMALIGGDIATSSFGDLLVVNDDEDIIQTAINNILTIKGTNEFHPGLGNDAHISRYKISEQGFNEIANRCKDAILQDIRIANVLEVVVENDGTESANNMCIVSFVLVTVDGKQLSSNTSMTIY